MKNKEFIIMILASALLFGFVLYMINLSYTSNRYELVRDDLKNDSLIFRQNKELKENDSVLKLDDKDLKVKVKALELRIKKLEGQKPKVRRDTIWMIKK